MGNLSVVRSGLPSQSYFAATTSRALYRSPAPASSDRLILSQTQRTGLPATCSSLGLNACAGPTVQTEIQSEKQPEKKGFFDAILGIFKAIFDLILAPFRMILGLFGIGSSGKASHKLTELEKAGGRAISLTGSGAPDTGAFGPHSVQRYRIDLPTRDGRRTPADLYIPEGQGPFPSLIHAYGLAGSRDKHAGTARHYASWGMIVVVPDLPHGSASPEANAAEIGGWVRWMHQRPPQLPASLSLEKGVALSGHSFGGLTAVLAGAEPGVGAVVALDPADWSGLGQRAGALRAPSAFIMGEASLANQFGNGNRIYAAAGGDKLRLKVKGAQHTDFENAGDDGAKNAANEQAMRLATGFLLQRMTGRPEYAAYGPGGAETRAQGIKAG